MKKTWILTGLLAVANLCLAQTQVLNYKPGMVTDGVTYFLPKTAIDITVTAEHTTYTPGDFCQYAEKYLRLTDVSTSASETWEIKRVTIRPTGVPDTTKVYTVKLKERTVAPLMDLTEDGIIKAINTTLAVTPEPKEQPEEPEAELNPRDYMNEEILMAGSSAKMAELTAKEIYNIRESKNTITRGQADSMPKDGESLKIMLKNLDEQEQALMQLFTGKTRRETKSVTVRVVPTGDLNREVVLRFSKKLGFVDADDLSGNPLFLTVTNQKNIPQAAAANERGKKITGVIYNVPSKADIIVADMNKTYYKGEINIAQFGNTEVLVGSLFNKKTTTKVTFDPTTGGLLRIEAANP